MDEHISTLDVYPSATPTEAEIAAWNALDRQEQLARMQQLLAEVEESGFSTSPMAEVIAAVRAEQKSENEKRGVQALD